MLIILAEIQNIQDELSFYTDINNFDDWDNRVNKQFMNFETELINKKSDKFERDRLDYLHGRELNWKLKNKSNRLQHSDNTQETAIFLSQTPCGSDTEQRKIIQYNKNHNRHIE